MFFTFKINKKMSLLNQKAPCFSLPDQNSKIHNLTDYKGKYVLLYFYPKALTPGCTTESCHFRDLLKELEKENVAVLGMSADPVKKLKKFEEKEKLNFPLLSDEEKVTLEAYNVWKKKKFMGREYMGIMRESFLIDSEGKVVKHYEKVKPKEHALNVLEDVKKIGNK